MTFEQVWEVVKMIPTDIANDPLIEKGIFDKLPWNAKKIREKEEYDAETARLEAEHQQERGNAYQTHLDSLLPEDRQAAERAGQSHFEIIEQGRKARENMANMYPSRIDSTDIINNSFDVFEKAWDVVKSPYHGTDSDSWRKIVEEGGMRPRTFAAGYRGESKVPEQVETTESDAMEDAWGYALNNILQYPAIDEESDATPMLLHIDPDHPDVAFEPDDRKLRSQYMTLMTLGDKGHLVSQPRIPLEAIEPVLEGDAFDTNRDDESEYYEAQMQMLRDAIE